MNDLVRNHEQAQEFVSKVFEELKKRGYKVKMDYTKSYYQNFGESKVPNHEIFFEDLKVTNNAFGVIAYMMEDTKTPFAYALWTYKNGDHKHKNYPTKELNVQEAITLIDEFFYKKVEISIFDLGVEL